MTTATLDTRALLQATGLGEHREHKEDELVQCINPGCKEMVKKDPQLKHGTGYCCRPCYNSIYFW